MRPEPRRDGQWQALPGVGGESVHGRKRGDVLVAFPRVDSLITPYIGSLKQFGHLRANYCQYWGIVEYCLEHGVPRFEFGRSPKGSTHVQFKRKWGAGDVEVVYNYLVDLEVAKGLALDAAQAAPEMGAGVAHRKQDGDGWGWTDAGVPAPQAALEVRQPTARRPRASIRV